MHCTKFGHKFAQDNSHLNLAEISSMHIQKWQVCSSVIHKFHFAHTFMLESTPPQGLLQIVGQSSKNVIDTLLQQKGKPHTRFKQNLQIATSLHLTFCMHFLHFTILQNFCNFRKLHDYLQTFALTVPFYTLHCIQCKVVHQNKKMYTRNFFMGFQMIAEIINRGSLTCAAFRPLLILLGSLTYNSFCESNMTAV